VRISAEIKPLLDAAKKNGYKIVPSGKHMKVLDSKGRVVIDKDGNGPVIISSTPSESRDRDMTVTKFIRNGIIRPEQDPWKPQKGKQADGTPETIDEEKQRREAARLEGLASANRERAERTRKIRSRWEPIIARLGGWDKRGMQSEAGLIVYHYAKTRGREEAPASVTSAQQMVIRVKRGDTLSAKACVCFEILLDDLERQPAKMQERWFDLLQEAKGLPPRREKSVVIGPPRPPAPVPAAGPLQVLEGGKDEEVFGPPAPTLALRALAEMMIGQPAERDPKELVDIAHQILEMELRR